MWPTCLNPHAGLLPHRACLFRYDDITRSDTKETTRPVFRLLPEAGTAACNGPTDHCGPCRLIQCAPVRPRKAQTRPVSEALSDREG